MLKPLNKFEALKTTDIQQQLSPNIVVEENGIIMACPDKPNLIEYFCELNANDLLLQNLSEEDKKKYQTILEVFSKARISSYKTDYKIINFNNPNYVFADPICISFDYIEMEKKIKKSVKNLYESYVNAFYLAKLRRYEESFVLLKQITSSSYKKQEYLLYYLSQINKINLSCYEKC